MPSTTPQPPEAGQPSPAFDSLNHSLELLWEGKAPTTKGPKPGLTLEEIVDAAVAVADADGVDALSMRRIARELDAGTMSLYRYVPDKSVLLDLMLDRVSAPCRTKDEIAGQSWREVLDSQAWESRALYLGHPWLLHINWTRPVLGPNTVAGLELVMSALTDLPVSDREKVMIITELDAYVQGSVRQQVLYEGAAEDTGIGEEEFWGAQMPYLERAIASGEYPTWAQMAEDSFDGGWDETFALGLRHLLDGLAADVAAR